MMIEWWRLFVQVRIIKMKALFFDRNENIIYETNESNHDTWLERRQALLRKKVREKWTEKHRNVAGQIFLEGGWTQNRLFDIDWSDTSQCQACKKEGGTEKHRTYHSPEWQDVRREIPEVFRKLEQKARTPKKEWKWRRGIVEHPLSGSQWNRGHFSMRKWESEEHKMRHANRRLQGPRCHWRLLAGKRWQVVSMCLGYDEEMELLHGMYGTMEAEFEVQRTIKMVELTAFLCLLRKVSGPIKVHVDNKGIIDWLRKGEKELEMHADLWIKIWEELPELVNRGILVEVAHVKGTPYEGRKREDDKNWKVCHWRKWESGWVGKSRTNAGRRIYDVCSIARAVS